MVSLQDEIRVSRVVFEYAAKIGQEQDPVLLLSLIADMGRALLGADRCSIWMVDAASGGLWTCAAHGVEPIRVPAGHGLVGACVASNDIILVNDALNDPRLSRGTDELTGYETRSVLCMPLRGRSGSVIGAFQALNKEGGFDAADIHLLHLACSYSANAIETQALRKEAEQAQFMLRELGIARDVQARLFPTVLPAIAGVEYECLCVPAKFVGGDYYDVIPMPGGRTCITLGDVSGKGIPAAVLMASVQASIRVNMTRGADSLAAAIAALNETVHSATTAERYTTLFAAFLEPGCRRMIYVNCGQTAPMLLRASGRIERLNAGGPPVGLLPRAPFQETAVDLASEDLLVVFSDGVSEVNNPAGDIWNEEELEQVVASCAGLPAGEAHRRILGAAQSFADGAEPSDDITLAVYQMV
ncbi:MAG: SpoIIE family protein phosphatase [Bryobacteraceae bacterium]|nr:SpoIIE family protein phosphatase [Bryobacteraceae bacterium]